MRFLTWIHRRTTAPRRCLSARIDGLKTRWSRILRRQQAWRQWLRGRLYATCEPPLRLLSDALSRLHRSTPLPLGEQGERAAVRHLGRQGYLIVARNAHETRGELDVIAVDGETLVFVEVKTRRREDQGRPGEAIDLEKQRRICDAAATFARRHQLTNHRGRFDVIEVIWPASARQPTIRHWPNAFEAPPR